MQCTCEISVNNIVKSNKVSGFNTMSAPGHHVIVYQTSVNQTVVCLCFALTYR